LVEELNKVLDARFKGLKGFKSKLRGGDQFFESLNLVSSNNQWKRAHFINQHLKSVRQSMSEHDELKLIMARNFQSEKV